MSRRQTFMYKPGETSKTWRVVDAEGVPLGRLAAQVAIVLMGKHRPEYTPHIDCGDPVIVINASKVELTGRKAEQRVRQWYTQYPGGRKTETLGQTRDRRPDVLIRDAVRRMLPKNRLARVMLKNLRVSAGAEHEFAQHKPETLTVAR
ncbi:MAG: 50S ribosomal protein L13 [Phycisphaerales bacterium]|nr:50S ribosomal protein L13 [Phycisphaerales bacterium]NUQ69123.1 50S ribosomal protein L13 [Phycisphaerales bacterium]